MAALYDHAIPEPIIACHRLKVLFALEDELAHAPDAPWASVVCAGVNRYLNTPMKRHHGLRTARQARDFVARRGEAAPPQSPIAVGGLSARRR